jgi:hypothetical protein
MVNSICLVQYEKSSRGFCAIRGMKQDFQKVSTKRTIVQCFG